MLLLSIASLSSRSVPPIRICSNQDTRGRDHTKLFISVSGVGVDWILNPVRITLHRQRLGLVARARNIGIFAKLSGRRFLLVEAGRHDGRVVGFGEGLMV